MGFFNKGMYYDFLYKQIKEMPATDYEKAVKQINGIIDETFGIPIIVYHEISDQNDPYCISQKTFRWQMKYLADHNYNTITYKELSAGDADYHGKDVIITFDDAREGLFKSGRFILDEFGFKATLFVAPIYQNLYAPDGKGDSISKFMGWDHINQLIADCLIEVGAHSNSHKDMSKLNDNDIREELRKSNEDILNRTGIRCRDFAFPYGRYKKEQLEIYENYYETISTLGSGLNHQEISMNQLRRTAILNMFKEKDFISILDFKALRDKFTDLKNSIDVQIR